MLIDACNKTVCPIGVIQVFIVAGIVAVPLTVMAVKSWFFTKIPATELAGAGTEASEDDVAMLGLYDLQSGSPSAPNDSAAHYESMDGENGAPLQTTAFATPIFDASTGGLMTLAETTGDVSQAATQYWMAQAPG